MEKAALTSLTFEQKLKDKKLMGSRCRRCGALFLPPRPLCSHCLGDAMAPYEFSGRGRIVAFTAIAVAPTFMLEEGYGRDNPYCCGIIELEEGPRIPARILGVDARNPQTIRIGTPVTAEFLERGERVFLAFRPSA